MGVGYRKHTELPVYQLGFSLGGMVFKQSRSFPKEETYSLTDQVRRSSRSVCANLAEAWRKRRYRAAFISKLSDAEAEAAETQVWLEFAVECNYIERDAAADLYAKYDEILAQIVRLIHNADQWILRDTRDPPHKKV